MSNPYGPWATLIDAGSNPQLSAFWRRRLTMLVSINQTSPMLSGGNWLCLVVLGVLMIGLPTFSSVPASADEEKTVVEDKNSTSSASTTTEAEKSGEISVTLEKTTPKNFIKLPNGGMIGTSSTTVTTIQSGDPKAVESVKRHHEEMKNLIAQKKYQFLRTFQLPFSEKQYVYKFTFSDGDHTNMNFSMPLDDVASWDDYQRKQQERETNRHEQISKAIQAGRFRLLNLEVIQIHVCRDVDSDRKYKVQRIPLLDGKVIALFRPFDPGVEKQTTAMPQMSWDDYLETIRQGKRELLSQETVTNYTYEMVLEDGTKTIFSYGGGEPLSKPESTTSVLHPPKSLTYPPKTVMYSANVGVRSTPPATPKTPDAEADQLVKDVTIFPIVLNSGAPIPGVSADMSKDMAQVVGLLLERAGMKGIEIADAKFIPPENADLAKAAEAFGQFSQSQNIKTEYAIYGQFFGTPGKGVDEIRLAVVDRQGKIILTKQIDRQQLLLKRSLSGEKIVDPMLACNYLVDPLREFWKLGDPNQKDAPQGEMAKLWEEKSGTPPKNEREAMQLRLNTLRKTIKTSTLAVYPVHVSGKGDSQLAMRLAEMLTKAGVGRAEAVSTDPNLQIQGNTNQTRILWDTARAFQKFLRENPPDADYVLLADYGIGRTSDGKTAVGGVQLVLCDHHGDWVLVGLQNSHHAVFKRINPQSPDDCNRIVVEQLESDLR